MRHARALLHNRAGDHTTIVQSECLGCVQLFFASEIRHHEQPLQDQARRAGGVAELLICLNKSEKHHVTSAQGFNSRKIIQPAWRSGCVHKSLYGIDVVPPLRIKGLHPICTQQRTRQPLVVCNHKAHSPRECDRLADICRERRSSFSDYQQLAILVDTALRTKSRNAGAASARAGCSAHSQASPAAITPPGQASSISLIPSVRWLDLSDHETYVEPAVEVASFCCVEFLSVKSTRERSVASRRVPSIQQSITPGRSCLVNCSYNSPLYCAAQACHARRRQHLWHSVPGDHLG